MWYALTEERVKSDNAPTIPFEEIPSEDEITVADLEAMEEMEIK